MIGIRVETIITGFGASSAHRINNQFGTIFAMAIKLRFAACLSIFPINKEEVIGSVQAM
jgi:hypothetical protein